MATARVESVAGRWEPVIGLEVHCQLKTRTKLFCGCPNRFGDPPNTNVCPVCLGLPGALPVLSREAVALALRAAFAAGCEVQRRSVFERKNYFYPDLPKGYQISQYALPLARGGRVEIAGGQAIGIERIHMEEDAGKLLHEGFAWTREKSGVDFNRAGVPLIEIVTRPDLRSPEQAHAYLTALRALLVYAGVSDCDMEKGSLRCDANVSLRPGGAQALGTRAEIKNLNSFRNVARALEHEILRQAVLLDAGRPVAQETRLFDAERGETASMRGKEEAHDYRYFPEPDLPPLLVSEAWAAEVRDSLPELPAERRRRFTRELGLPEYDADVLTQEPEVADYFEAAARACADAKAASNWVMTDVLRKRKDDPRPLAGGPVPPERLGELIRLVAQGTINGNTARQVFETMWASGEPALAIVEREGLAQVSDAGALGAVIAEVIAANPQQVATYRAGKQSALGWFVGQVMRKSGGKANPQLVNELLRKALG
jgi:aspartyl-tRNA(Asn)/glutamyl-tRNA(Gln) amidotransferase subunit B